MKKVRTFRIDTEISDKLDQIKGPYTYGWHIEQALNGYGPIKGLTAKAKPAPKLCDASPDRDEMQFNHLWRQYGKKGNRKTSLAKYSRLSERVQILLSNSIIAYVLSTPDKQYRKNFETYINQECWNDEVTPNGQNQSGSNSGGHKLSAVERVKATTEANRAARASERGDMGDPHGDIRREPSQPIRDINAQSVGQTIDGTYTEEY